MTKNKHDITIIKECLNAAVNGPFFPDWEFATLFGLTRTEVKAILNQWPDVDFDNEQVKIAINNSLNNLLGYPINNSVRWNQFISVTPRQLKKIFINWRKDMFG